MSLSISEILKLFKKTSKECISVLKTQSQLEFCPACFFKQYTVASSCVETVIFRQLSRKPLLRLLVSSVVFTGLLLG